LRKALAWIRAGCAALAVTGLILAPISAAQAADDDDSISIIRDTEIEHILHEEADPIFVAAGLDPKAVQIHLVSSDELQSFAAGGQQIFVYSGLILETKNPNELIGVPRHSCRRRRSAGRRRQPDLFSRLFRRTFGARLFA
jgi:predicted Zn-dependent protease